MTSHAAIVNQVFDQDLDEVAAMIKDPKMYKRFQERRIVVRNRLADSVEKS